MMHTMLHGYFYKQDVSCRIRVLCILKNLHVSAHRIHIDVAISIHIHEFWIMPSRIKMIRATALDADLGSIIWTSKWFCEIIYASHPNPFGRCRIIKWKPVMVPFICSCCYYCIFNSKENCRGQKEWRLTYSL